MANFSYSPLGFLSWQSLLHVSNNYIKNEGAVLGLTLIMLMGSPIWLDKLNLGWFIMHIKGSKDRISSRWICISEDFSKQCSLLFLKWPVSSILKADLLSFELRWGRISSIELCS